jgi:hypothetical protein
MRVILWREAIDISFKNIVAKPANATDELLII